MKKPKIITIAHTKGGVGKSTLSWNIATELKRRGFTVSVFDLDFQKTLCMSDDLRRGDPLAPLPALGVRPVRAGDIESFREAVTASKSNSDYTIVDVGGFDSELNRTAISLSDFILCPVKESIHEILGFHAFAAVLSQIDSPVVHLVFNMAHPKTTNFESLREPFDGYKSIQWLDSVVRFRAGYCRALARGRGVVEYDTEYFAKAKADIEALVSEVLECLKK